VGVDDLDLPGDRSQSEQGAEVDRSRIGHRRAAPAQPGGEGRDVAADPARAARGDEEYAARLWRLWPLWRLWWLCGCRAPRLTHG
jgi:hypothetical protein